MIRSVAQRFNNFLLTLISMVVLFHSVSLYAVSTPDTEEVIQVEMSQDVEDQEVTLRVYDALIPTFQSMAPMVLYFIHEVVLLSQSEYRETSTPVYYENQFLEVLFPLIISPNAP